MLQGDTHPHFEPPQPSAPVATPVANTDIARWLKQNYPDVIPELRAGKEVHRTLAGPGGLVKFSAAMANGVLTLRLSRSPAAAAPVPAAEQYQPVVSTPDASSIIQYSGQLDVIFENRERLVLAIASDHVANHLRTLASQQDWFVHTLTSADELRFITSRIDAKCIVVDERADAFSACFDAVFYLATQKRLWTTVILVSEGFRSGDEIQAFSQSVDLVVNYADLGNLQQLLERVERSRDIWRSQVLG